MSSTISSNHSLKSQWLALTQEPIMDPEREIVDPHHHLWVKSGEPYLLPEILDDLGTGHLVTQTVFVQCRAMYRISGPTILRPVGEVEFATGIAAMSASGLYGAARVCSGIVGCADLKLGSEVTKVLEVLARAGGERLKGIRCPVAYHPDEAVRSTPALSPPELMLDPRFQTGAKELAKAGLSLDLWAYHTQLPELYQLAAAVPELTIIVDHVGGPIGVGPYAGQRNEVFRDWKDSMSKLASVPNVHVKLGGLGQDVGGFAFDEAERPPSSAMLAAVWQPYIGTCIELFGPNRCMFESNFPVDKTMVSYPVLWNAFKRIASGFTEDEKHALFAGTARHVYKLSEPGL
jgi:predicted TIM-barrel fold metal-dependent hydrolase